jgi:outer membrane receptor protein involved in Fe transport
LNISYRPNEQSLYYVQWSEGFRLGEPTPGVPDFCDADGDGLVDGLGLPIPTQLNSDGLDAWEIGSKLSFMDNRVEVRAAAFYNQWSDFPITLTADCGFFVAYNAGEAETRGIELEGSAQLSEHWRLDFSVGYLKGELTADAPGLGLDGDRLPGSPEYTASLGLQYDFLLHSHSSFIRGDLATVGGYYNNLQQAGPEAGDYTTLNLAAGMQLGHWDLQVFMQNVTNSSAATWISPFTEYGSVYRLRPRTTGFSLRYAF